MYLLVGLPGHRQIWFHYSRTRHLIFRFDLFIFYVRKRCCWWSRRRGRAAHSARSCRLHPSCPPRRSAHTKASRKFAFVFVVAVVAVESEETVCNYAFFRLGRLQATEDLNCMIDHVVDDDDDCDVAVSQLNTRITHRHSIEMQFSLSLSLQGKVELRQSWANFAEPENTNFILIAFKPKLQNE